MSLKLIAISLCLGRPFPCRDHRDAKYCVSTPDYQMTTEQLYSIFLQHPLISTDTRKIAAGSLFFALKGDKFDANTFAEKAI
jgi:UDP-N-acetylmuramyl tripeptide synthase